MAPFFSRDWHSLRKLVANPQRTIQITVRVSFRLTGVNFRLRGVNFRLTAKPKTRHWKNYWQKDGLWWRKSAMRNLCSPTYSSGKSVWQINKQFREESMGNCLLFCYFLLLFVFFLSNL